MDQCNWCPESRANGIRKRLGPPTWSGTSRNILTMSRKRIRTFLTKKTSQLSSQNNKQPQSEMHSTLLCMVTSHGQNHQTLKSCWVSLKRSNPRISQWRRRRSTGSSSNLPTCKRLTPLVIWAFLLLINYRKTQRCTNNHHPLFLCNKNCINLRLRLRWLKPTKIWMPSNSSTT